MTDNARPRKFVGIVCLTGVGLPILLIVCYFIGHGCGLIPGMLGLSFEQRKLGPIQASPATITVNCPRGEGFCLLLGLPENIQLPANFTGTVTVRCEGQIVYEGPISSKYLGGAGNWLDRYGLDGLMILDSHRHSVAANWKPGKAYVVSIEYVPPLPPGVTLCLTWLERY